jgi:hypothetical protein
VKCIECDHDSRYRDRAERRCPKCRHEFAFETRRGDPFTDAAFQSAIDAVSAKGRVRWGVEHLYYELCRRRRRPRVPPLGVLVVVLVAGFLGLQSGSGVVAVLSAVVAAGVFVWLMRRRVAVTVQLPRATFEAQWQRWQAVHGRPKGVIVRRSSPPAPRAAEPDLADYSFDRAVVCDRARTVDLLLANNFHFENNCAVLSVGGYPPGPFETIRAMLRRNPRLQVFALHDATGPGCRLAHRLATSPEWFQGLAAVTDVGLRPEHARPFRGVLLPADGGPVAPGDGISRPEAAWLSRHTLELAAIRPEQVLKRLFRALNRVPERERDGDGGSGSSVHYDTDSFGDDAGDSDGGADAFG